MSGFIHQLPGRIRIKCPMIRDSTLRASALERLLRADPAVIEAAANPVTGSVLIRFKTTDASADDVLALVHEAGFDTKSAPVVLQSTFKRRARRAPAGLLVRSGGNVRKAVLGLLVEKALERSAIALIGAVL